MKLGRLLIRLVVGGLFIGHGTQKLFGWFSGPGPEGAGEMMARIGLAPPRHHALLAGVTETAGGALMAAGLATPLASAALIGSMVTAIEAVTAKRGPWVQKGGYEYNLMLIATLFDLVETGPGELSADHALGIRATGPRWAFASLGAGAVCGSAVVAFGRRRARLAAAHAAEQQPDSAEPAVIESREVSGAPSRRRGDGTRPAAPEAEATRRS